MPRRVSASEAKTRFGEMLAWAHDYQDDIIVESRGRPSAVIISFQEYQRILDLREKARREEALARLERLRQRVSARNKGLTEEEAESVADALSREAVESLIQKGAISYQGS